MRFLKQIYLLALVALLGCQAQPPIEAQPSVSMRLPTEFSRSFQDSFQANPGLTAERFLQAFDGFAKYGPVTSQSVQDHSRLRASLERGQILGGILSIDLNGDGLITRKEYETLSGLPNGNKKFIRMAGLFDFDINQNGSINVEEAILFGENLNALRSQNNLFPIESYLMLFDINTDGEVLREEVVRALYAHLPESERTLH